MNLTNFVYCPNCGYELDSDDEYCPNCSTMVERVREGYVEVDPEEYLPEDEPEEEPPTTHSYRTENATLAMILSVILPGIGAVVAGNKMGLVVFGLSVVFVIVAYSSIILVPFSVSVLIVLWIIGLWMTSEETTITVEGSPM